LQIDSEFNEKIPDGAASAERTTTFRETKCGEDGLNKREKEVCVGPIVGEEGPSFFLNAAPFN